MRTFVELERIIWRTSKVFVFGNPYNTVLATKPEAASRSRQTLASSKALGGVAETDCLSPRGPTPIGRVKILIYQAMKGSIWTLIYNS